MQIQTQNLNTTNAIGTEVYVSSCVDYSERRKNLIEKVIDKWNKRVQ